MKKIILFIALFVAAVPMAYAQNYQDYSYGYSGFWFSHSEKGHPIKSLYFSQEVEPIDHRGTFGWIIEFDERINHEIISVHHGSGWGSSYTDNLIVFRSPKGERFEVGVEYKVDFKQVNEALDYPTFTFPNTAVFSFQNLYYKYYNDENASYEPSGIPSNCTGSFTILNFNGSNRTLINSDFFIKYKILCGSGYYNRKKSEGTIFLKNSEGISNRGRKQLGRKAPTGNKEDSNRKLGKKTNQRGRKALTKKRVTRKKKLRKKLMKR